MNYKLRVSILKASSAVNVNAAILEEKSKTALATGSGTFNAGLVYTKFMHLQSFLLCVRVMIWVMIWVITYTYVNIMLLVNVTDC